MLFGSKFVILMGFILFLILSSTFADAAETKSLYEKIAIPQIIIVGTVLEDDQKYALVRIDETLKGSLEEQSINISFRRDNFDRRPGERKIEFTKGEKVILLLKPVVTASGKEKKNLYSLVGRAEGMILISQESIDLFADAIRRFVRIQAMKSQYKIWDEHKALLKEKNRLMVEAGLQEIIKFRTATSDMIPMFLEFIRGDDPEFRLYACRIFSQLFEKEERTGQRMDGREEVVRELIRKARGEDSVAVRVEAIRAFSKSDAGDYRELLEAISTSDESQEVRYEAQKALYEMKYEKKN